MYSAQVSQGKKGQSPIDWAVDIMDLRHSRSVKLNDGNLMPVLGFGTFASKEVSRYFGTTGLETTYSGSK